MNQTLLEEPRHALPNEEPTNRQVVNAIAWAIDKLAARIVGFLEGMEGRAGHIEERLGRIEESLEALHEEKGRTAKSDKRET